MIECTIKELYDFQQETGLVPNNFEVETRYGLKTIEAVDITAENSPVMEIQTTTKSIKTSPDHHLYSSDWISTKNLLVGDELLTVDGYEQVINTKLLSYTENLYDLQVAEVSEFYANGVVSHNSTIMDAIHYGFFGKPFRKVNIPKLVNSINKRDLLVEITFKTNDNLYLIRRGIKPDIFEIYKNESLIDQEATKHGYQQYLETDILQFNEDIFQQIGIKSLTRYDSFLTMPRAKKRTIIENIFGIEVLSEMKDLNKQEIDRVEGEISNHQKEVTKYEMLLAQESKNIQKLQGIQEKLNDEIDEKNKKKEQEIVGIKTEIIQLNKAHATIGNHKQTINAYKDMVERNYDILRNNIKYFTDLDNKIRAFDTNICFIKDNCADCPNIEKLEHNDEVEGWKTEYFNIEEERQKIIEENNNLEDTIEEEIENFVSKEPLILSKIKQKKQEINRIRSYMEQPREVATPDYTKYNCYKDKIADINGEIEKKNSGLEYNKVIYTILQDDGIRSYIIKQYLPLINKLMNTYLQQFSIDLELEFTSELDIDIKTKFKENYAYESFSEGEKKRINLSLMFTFLEFCKLKHSNASINILILDEFSHGMDADAENILYDVLKGMVEKEGKEIITVTHSALIDPEKISRLYHVERGERGFSKLELVEE